MKATKPQIKAIQTLLSKQGLAEHKADIVRQFCKHAEPSVSKLDVNEARELIAHLVSYQETDEGAACDRMRKKLLWYGYEMGWDKPANSQQYGLKASTVNFQNVNAWCRSERCSARKSMNQMTSKELATTVSQLELVYKSYLKELSKV